MQRSGRFTLARPAARVPRAPRELALRTIGACALADWLAEPVPKPMGARLIVRRAAGRRGGRGRPVVAVETPGEYRGGAFGASPGWGRGSADLGRKSRGAGLRGEGRGAEAGADRGKGGAPPVA